MKNKKIISILLLITLIPNFSLAGIDRDPEAPEIISREQWGADESKMTWEVEYANIEKFVIHHTASSDLQQDTDGSGEYKDMVNNIYEYHAAGKTWVDSDGDYIKGFGDVGYNYIVDPNGNIYEARSGGNGAIGGHVSGFNTGTVGISVIGNFEKESNVSSDVVESLEKLIGWIAANNSININESSYLNDKKVDGVVGHRDLAATLCPGEYLYAKLDSIQSNAYSYYKIYKDYAYKIKGSSAVYILEDGYKIRYKSESDLPEEYEDREIKYISASQLDAYQYKDLELYPDGSLLKEKNNNTVYYIDGTRKRALEMTGEDFLKLGFKEEEIITVTKSELTLYKDGGNIKIGPEGKLVKDESNDIYFIENGRKRLFTSAALFEKLGYSWSKVTLDTDVKYYLEGDVMTYPNGTLIKTEGKDSVYITNGTERRVFTSGEMFEELGYSWKNIIEITKSETNNYKLVGNVIYPDGTLIKGNRSDTVYLVENGKKREISSQQLLSKLGYKASQVKTIQESKLNDYGNGSAMKYPDGVFIKSESGSTVYKVENGTKKEITSLSLFNSLGIAWSDIIEVSVSELSNYSYGGTVRYPENSLLKKEGDDKIYVIKSGEAQWIQTAEEFTKNGYKWSNIIEITKAEMSLYVKEDTEEEIKTEVEQDEEVITEEKEEETQEETEEIVEEETQEEEQVETETEIKSEEPIMRVAITYSQNDDIEITANGDYTVNYYDENGNLYKTVKKIAEQKTVVPFFDWEKYINFVPESEDTILQVLSYKDPSWNGESDDNRFRGNLELKYSETSQKLWVINELPLEDYLNGIAEATTYTEDEYMKAFSTIARTYAMYYIERGGKHTGEDFYLKNSRNGNGNDQVYRGYDLEIRAPQVVEGNQETEGSIIKYNGKTIVAAYSSDSGGVTKSACNVLSKNYCADEYDYLDGGIKDPEDTIHSQSKISASHGAGMSAVGAEQMAKEGSDWKEIIEYYYPGVNIEKYY